MDGRPTPVIFTHWSAIYAVGASVRRNVWCELIPGLKIYANLFIFLVGPPGVGKTIALVPMADTLRKSDSVKIGPNDISKQGLLDELVKCPDTLIGIPGRVPENYHYMALVIRELSNFMSQYDGALAGILTDLFDNPPVNQEGKRSGAGKIIVNPSIAMIAGTATRNLGATISGDLWGQGFMSRIILVHSADQPEIEWFGGNYDAIMEDEDVARVELDPELIENLGQIGDMKGKMTFMPSTRKAMNVWRKSGFKPVPTHSKLVEYNARRFLHVAKLCMISALSDKRMEIEASDFHRALDWLETAERAMPEIFKEMVIHSDGETIRELHQQMWVWYLASGKKRPIHYTQMAGFLYTKVASREIPRLIEAGESTGHWDRMAGTQGLSAQYVPKIQTEMLGDDIG